MTLSCLIKVTNSIIIAGELKDICRQVIIEGGSFDSHFDVFVNDFLEDNNHLKVSLFVVSN